MFIDILKECTAESLKKCHETINLSKTENESVCLGDNLSLSELVDQMQILSNQMGIPVEDFSIGTLSSYSMIGTDTNIHAFYEVVVDRDDKEILAEFRRKFTMYLMPRLIEKLKPIGYVRKSIYSSRDFAKFDPSTPYDMYVSGDIDMLVEWYSNYFRKVESDE